MIRHVEQALVSGIFTDEKPIVYKIPKYQRAYTWGQNEWDQLFNDILENSIGYFLGSMICVRSTDTGSVYDSDVLELIDGQQRTTSLSLLLLALYKKLEPYKINLDDDDLADFVKIRKRILIKNTKTNKMEPRLRLQVQDCNDEDYKALLTAEKLIDGYQKIKNAGNRRIFKAYSHFCKLIDNFINSSDEEKNNAGISDCATPEKALLSLYRKISGAAVVMIEVESHSDAFMLFESLNFRGAKLNAIDLIKNVLMAVAEKNGKSDDCYDTWQKIQERLGDEYSPQERFFRQYYNAFRDELNEPFTKVDKTKKYPLAYKATKSTLMNIYEKLIKADYLGLLNKIDAASEKYGIIVNRITEGVSDEYSEKLLNLERIQGAPSYMLLLFLELNRDELGLTEKDLIKIAQILIVFFVRRNVTDVPNTRNLDKIFMDIIQNIKDKNGSDVYDSIRDTLISVSASNEFFEEKLRGPIYIENDTATRFILCYIESLNQTKEIYSDLWKRDNSNKYVWTIEHIFPEGENIPSCWVDMIAEGDASLAKEYREKYVHTLGNLTMTGYNPNLSNKSYLEKKHRKNSEGKEIGYLNGLFLNSTLATQDNWSVEDIKSRTDYIVTMALEKFKL